VPPKRAVPFASKALATKFLRKESDLAKVLLKITFSEVVSQNSAPIEFKEVKRSVEFDYDRAAVTAAEPEGQPMPPASARLKRTAANANANDIEEQPAVSAVRGRGLRHLNRQQPPARPPLLQMSGPPLPPQNLLRQAGRVTWEDSSTEETCCGLNKGISKGQEASLIYATKQVHIKIAP
jgi:hypothetical protein